MAPTAPESIARILRMVFILYVFKLSGKVIKRYKNHECTNILIHAFVAKN